MIVYYYCLEDIAEISFLHKAPRLSSGTNRHDLIRVDIASVPLKTPTLSKGTRAV